MKITSVQVVIGIWLLLIAAAGIYNVVAKNTDPSDTAVVIGDGTQYPSDVPMTPCVAMPKIVGDKTVVLRIDDVQAFAWPTTTRMMILDAESRNIPLSLGIIPKRFSQDTELNAFLKQRDCRLEFALHGLDHQSHGDSEEFAEFDELTKEEARARLEEGLAELAVFTDKPIRTWIPPLNSHSAGTQKALEELGFTRFSTEGKAKWDYDAATFSYDVNELTDTDKVIADCATSFATSDMCIIMLHPQDFTTDDLHDDDKYNDHYLDLLDRLFGKGYSFGTFSDVDTEA